MQPILYTFAATILLTASSIDGQGCSWNTSSNSNTNNGSPQSGANTAGACQTACLNAPPCSAVDFDSNGPNGIFCWFSPAGGSVNYGSANGVTHYNYVCQTGATSGVSVITSALAVSGAANSAVVTGATTPVLATGVGTGTPSACTWNASANSNSLGGIVQSQYTTLADCQKGCLAAANSSCKDVDWDSNGVSSNACWFSTTPIINYNGANGVTHYQCVGGGSTPSSCYWNMSVNSFSPGGISTSYSKLSDCQNFCLNRSTSGCPFGIDWNPTTPQDPTTPQCWFSNNTYVLYGSYPGVYHFNYVGGCSSAGDKRATVSGILLSTLLLFTILTKMALTRRIV